MAGHQVEAETLIRRPRLEAQPCKLGRPSRPTEQRLTTSSRVSVGRNTCGKFVFYQYLAKVSVVSAISI